MSEREKYEIFENYLKGKLDGSQKEEFEKLLSSDGDSLKQFEEYREVHLLIKDSSLLDIKEQLSSIHIEQLRIQQFWKYFKYGAYTLAIIIVSVILYFTLKKPRTADNIEAKPVNPDVMKPDTTIIPVKALNVESSSLTPSRKQTEIRKNQAKIIISDTKGKDTLMGLNKSSLKNDVSVIENKRKTIDPLPVNMKAKSKTPDKKDVLNPDLSKNVLFDCATIKISCKYNIDEACEETAQGKILFNSNSIKGGKAPYMFSINNGTEFSFDPAFIGLAGGQYKLKVKDKNDCTTFIGIAELKEIVCPVDFVIAPEREELWQIPYEKDKSGKLFIYTKSGNLVYTSEIDQSFKPTWDGKSSDGRLLSLGAYIFRINYSNARKLNGTITIVK